MTFLKLKSLHSPSSLFEAGQSWSPFHIFSYLLSPFSHFCTKFLWSQISLSQQQQHNKWSKLIQNDWRKIHSWILKHVWRSGAFQPIGNLADYPYNWKIPSQKKKNELNWCEADFLVLFMYQEFSHPFHLISEISTNLTHSERMEAPVVQQGAQQSAKPHCSTGHLKLNWENSTKVDDPLQYQWQTWNHARRVPIGNDVSYFVFPKMCICIHYHVFMIIYCDSRMHIVFPLLHTVYLNGTHQQFLT